MHERRYRLALRTSHAARQMVDVFNFEQAKLAAIVSSSDDAIISKNLNSIIQSWNSGAERLFGYKAEEMIGESILRLIPPDRASEEDLILSRLRQGERIDHYETIRRRKDGTLVPVSVSVSPLRDREGRIVGASKIARDMSQQRTAEAELQSAKEIAEKSLAQLRAVVENMSEGLVLSDAGGNLLEWNASALEMHGFSTLEEATRPLIDFERQFQLIGPDGAEIPLKDWPMSRVLRGESLSRAEYVVRRLDVGREWIISYSGKPVRASSGQILLALVTLHDVTQERRVQKAIEENAERLSLALATADLGDWNWDASSDEIILSERALEIFGLSPGAALTRSQLRDMLEASDREARPRRIAAPSPNDATTTSNTA